MSNESSRTPTICLRRRGALCRRCSFPVAHRARARRRYLHAAGFALCGRSVEGLAKVRATTAARRSDGERPSNTCRHATIRYDWLKGCARRRPAAGAAITSTRRALPQRRGSKVATVDPSWKTINDLLERGLKSRKCREARVDSRFSMCSTILSSEAIPSLLRPRRRTRLKSSNAALSRRAFSASERGADLVSTSRSPVPAESCSQPARYS